MLRKISDLYPGCKILFVISLIFSGLIINQVNHYVVLIGVFILFSIILRIFLNYLQSVLKVLLLLSVIMFFMVVLTTAGNTLLFEIGFFRIYEEGLGKALLMVLRIALVFSGVILITKLVTVEDMTMVLEKIGIPSLGVFVIQSTITMIPQLKSKMSVIMDAQASRGMQFSGNLFTRIKKMIPLLFPLILSSFYDTEEKTLVLISRGIEITGRKYRLYDKKPANVDFVIMAFSSLIMIVSIFWRLR